MGRASDTRQILLKASWMLASRRIAARPSASSPGAVRSAAFSTKAANLAFTSAERSGSRLEMIALRSVSRTSPKTGKAARIESPIASSGTIASSEA